MDDRLLDRPVWSALTTVHARHTIGTDRARRFEADIGPFGAARDESDESLAELGSLIASSGPLLLAQAPEIACPPGVRIAKAMLAQQMHHDRPDLPPLTGVPIRRLGDADAAAMVELASLTNPGPFERRTHELGVFWGVEQEGRLAAMAGERFKQPGFCEISGVCTHPDFHGRGYARELCLVVLGRIRSRGEHAYLHVFSDNAGAIALYEKLGFRTRREIRVGVLEAA